jgi:hypothetical protein
VTRSSSGGGEVAVVLVALPDVLLVTGTIVLPTLTSSRHSASDLTR